MYRIIAYLKFLLSSRNQHGVHSPFIYQFVTQCLYDKTKHEAYEQIKNYRQSLLEDHTVLNINDFGAGSKVFSNNRREVSKMAKYAGSTINKAKLLYKVTKYFHPNLILELGTSLGIASYSMSCASEDTHVLSIEGCQVLSNYTQIKFHDLAKNNIEILNGKFLDVIPKIADNKYDLIFIDGNHTKSATLENFNAILPLVKNDTVLILDDIYWSSEMYSAWKMIKENKKVRVTVDCFHLGFVFFRKEQAKEHFKIRL